jgi:Staphylococcus phage HNH endonuclease
MFEQHKSHPKHHLTGQRFGRLVVLKFTGSRRSDTRQSARRFWLCRCDCGNHIDIRTDQLTTGTAQSCGCLQSELTAKQNKKLKQNLKHGEGGKWPLRRSVEYTAWVSIKARCLNQNYHHYNDYGGRGITVCRRWRDSFEAFLTDMGRKPSPQHSLDRKNNNGNYNKRKLTTDVKPLARPR